MAQLVYRIRIGNTSKFVQKLSIPSIWPIFLLSFPLKLVGLDSELKSAASSSAFKNSPTTISNPNRKYLEICQKTQYFDYVTYFPVVIPLETGRLDSEWKSAASPSAFRNSPTSISNPDRKYLEICPKTQYFEYLSYFSIVMPLETGLAGCRIKFCNLTQLLLEIAKLV